MVTFTGTQSDSDAVLQTFVADQQTSFRDLHLLIRLHRPRLGQLAATAFHVGDARSTGAGLHQFDNIVAAPSPAVSLTLLGRAS